MFKRQPLARTFRIFTATCGILSLLTAYTIAFAHEHTRTLHAAGNTDSNIVPGRI